MCFYKMVKFSKKGSHVGVILSFVIFIVFLVFLFSALQPALKIEKDKTSTLEYIKNSLIERTSDNLTIENIKYTVRDIVGETRVDCIIVRDNSGRKVIVKDVEDNLVSYSHLVNDVTIYGLEAGDNFFKVYYSNSIEEQLGTGSCSNPAVVDEATFVNKENVIFISKIRELSETDYNVLKQTLGIGGESDFGFVLLDAEKNNLTGIKGVEIKTNVYVDDFPVIYSNQKGEIKSGFINIKVW